MQLYLYDDDAFMGGHYVVLPPLHNLKTVGRQFVIDISKINALSWTATAV